MKHEDIVGKLSEYRDGALGASERESVSRHAADCADCAAVLSDWERLSKAFFARPPAPTVFQTEAFAARVMSRLSAAETGPLSWLTGRWLVPALGLSFGLLALSFLPGGGADALDPASSLLLSRADRGATASSRVETPAADVLGLSADER
jgi:anti-sigma factor RsiW